MPTKFFIPFLAILVVLLVFQIIRKPKSSKSAELKQLRKLLPVNKDPNRVGWGAKVYPFLEKLPLMRSVLYTVRRRLTLMGMDSEILIRDSISKSALNSVGLAAIMIVFSFLFFDSFHGKLSGVLVSIYIITLVLDRTVIKAESKFLIDLDFGIEMLKDSYSSSKMVLVSLEDAADKVPLLVSRQFHKIHMALSAEDPASAIEDYYESSPNDFLRKVAGICYNVIETGDTHETESKLILSLTNTLDELRMERLAREQLDSKTAGTKFVVLAPILFVEVARNWAMSSFDETRYFLEGRLGMLCYALMDVTVIACLVAATMIRGMSSGDRTSKDETRFLNYLLSKRFVRIMIERFAPTNEETLRSRKIVVKSKELFRKANSSLTVSHFYLRKVLYAFAGFFLAVILLVGSHQMAKTYLLDKGAAHMEATTDGEYRERDRRVFESQIVEEYHSANLSDPDIIEEIKQRSIERTYASLDEAPEKYAESVVAKVSQYQGNTFQWYEVFIALGVAYLVYFVPNIILSARANIRKWEMRREVDGFYTLIQSLVKTPTIMVYTLLEEMHRYSSIFKPALSKALTSYSAGAKQCLENLQEDVNFDKLSQLVDRLLTAEETGNVRAAFADIEGNRKYSMAEREANHQKVISSRVSIANTISPIPVMLLIVLFIGLPIGTVMYNSISTTMDMQKTLK